MIKPFIMNTRYLGRKNASRFAGHLKKHVLIFIFFTILSFSLLANTFVLTSNGDTHAVSPTTSALDAGGQITLRSALEAATQILGSHTITIPASITVINITLGQITVGDPTKGINITVNGPGKGVLTVNQTTLTRIFFTGTGAINFSLNDLTLNYTGPVGSFSGSGGAIQAGGVNAVTSLTNVAITNFNVQVANGGAVSCSISGAQTMSLTGCDFTNNKCGGGGGAVSFVGNTSCTITNCTFTNNQTAPVGANTGGSGGALSVTGTGNGGIYTVTNCTFVNNFATSQGGAIMNTNGALTATFCRFTGNTATVATNGNTIAQAGGASVQTVNSNNNWWGVNAPTANDNVVLAAGGTITCTKWLQLKLSAASGSTCSGVTNTITASFLSNSAGEAVTTGNISRLIGLPISFVNPALGTLSAAQATIQASGAATVVYTAGTTAGAGSVNGVVDNVPGNDATAKASITALAGPTSTGNPSASTSCAGLAVTFSASAINQTSLVWQESANVGFSSPTNLTNTGIYSGATSASLTISDNTTVNGKYYRLVSSNVNGCPSANSSGVLLTATSPTLSTNNTVVQTVGTGNNIYYAASCAVVCKVLPSGASPVSGSVSSQVWVEGAVPTVSGQPFVQRHYQVTPASSPGTATASVTLYFSQAEFDNFNSHPNSFVNLPTGSGDAAGKANLRVGKYSGSTNNGTGLPGSYVSTVLVIDPPDANIVWNASFSRWEVTVDVTGFSGFVVQTAVVPLPIKLISFTAQYSNNASKIQWAIAQPEDGGSYALQRSSDASSFATINTQQGNAAKTQFNYSDPVTTAGKWYYRLMMTDRNGKITYSDIVFVRVGSTSQEITIYPNPVKTGADIRVNLQNITASKLTLGTVAGQQLWGVTNAITGSYSIHLPFAVAKGIYMLKIYTGESVETRKIMIE
jgi:hypothetical protein